MNCTFYNLWLQSTRAAGPQSPGAVRANDTHREPAVLESRHDLEKGPLFAYARVDPTPDYEVVHSDAIGVPSETTATSVR